MSAGRRWKRTGAAAVLVAVALAAAGAPPAAATDDTAYARLLAAHVRPGTVSGIDLALVDYEAVRRDPGYARALQDLAAARLETLPARADRLAFWINAYNLLAIKAVLDRYPTQSIRDGGTLLKPIWKKKVGVAAGREYALDDIEHGILRPEFRDPRVHTAIVCASLSCPDLRREPFTGARLEAQLDDQAMRFLANPTKGVAPAADGASARVSSIFKWFRDDFAPSGGVAAFIRRKADPALASRVGRLTDAGLGYLDYDWSLNDAKRAR